MKYESARDSDVRQVPKMKPTEDEPTDEAYGKEIQQCSSN
jgi:hypothetical protein